MSEEGFEQIEYMALSIMSVIVKMQELQDRVAKVKDSNEEMMKIRKEIVDLHGEMVLLENYSALNYTGTMITINMLLLNWY